MALQVQNMDIYDQQIGRGVGGRMADLLTKSGFSAAAVSLFGAADALVSNRVQTFILDSWRGMADLNPSEWAQPIWDRVKQLNAASNLGKNNTKVSIKPDNISRPTISNAANRNIKKIKNEIRLATT